MQELFNAYLAYKKELSRRVRRMVRKIPDSVLHHKLNLNLQTIARVRKGEDLRIETLRQLYENLAKQKLKH